jgi:hypothetical protein
VRSLRADLERVQRHAQVIDRACERREVIDEVDSLVDRLAQTSCRRRVRGRRVKRARAAQALRTPLRRLSKHRATLEEKSISGPSFLDHPEED